jgi:hypothetical protein
MNEPIKQHYIPQSYLKYFATEEKGVYLVDVYDESEAVLLRRQNIANICYKKNLYTLDTADPKKKYFLETFYAQNVDNHFTEIHDILTDPNILVITAEQKHKIISCFLSLYFRTTKFLHGRFVVFERFLEFVLNREPTKEDLSFTFSGRKYSFKRSEIVQFKSMVKEEFRQDYILSHLEYWTNYFQKKLQNGLSVCRITGDIN